MLALFALLSAALFWPQVGQGRALFWGDIGLYFRPLAQFLHAQLRGGRLPLWNPYTLCGTPFAGNPQASLLYPPTLWLTGAGGADTWINAGAAFHAAWAGWGAYLLLRVGQGRGAWAALLGGITFGFGGALVSKEQFPNMMAAAAWLPFALLFVKLLAQNFYKASSVRAGIGLGVTVGMQLLAAHAQITLLTFYLCAAYGAALAVAQKSRGRPPRPPKFGGRELQAPVPALQGLVGTMRSKANFLALPPPKLGGPGGPVFAPPAVIGGLCIALVVAVGLSAVQVLPDAAVLHDAWRQRLSFAVVNRFYLPLDQMGNWILPRLHGSPAEGTFTGRGNFWETCCYVGLAPFLLAIWGAWAGRKERETRFWTGVFAVGVWLATGGAGGLYHLAYWVLPGVRAFHDPARCLVLAAFALSVLAARGLDAVHQRSPLPSPADRRGAEKYVSPSLPLERGRGPGGGGLPAVLTRTVCAALALLAFADLTHFDRAVYPLAPVAALSPLSANVAAVLHDPDVRAGQARLMAPDTARVWQRFTGHRAYRGDAPSYQLLWADTLTPNLPFADGLRDASGYEPVARRDATAAAGNAAAGLRGAVPDGAWAGVLGVKWVALCRARVPAGASLKVIRAASTLAALGQTRDTARTLLCLNNNYQPRARLTANFLTCPTQAEMWALLSRAAAGKSALDVTKTTVVVGPVPFASPPGDAPGTVSIVEDLPDEVTLRADISRPCLLVLADTLAPGWSATVDGRPVIILSAQGMVRAVALPRAGRHQVTFVYRPEPFRLGLFVSLVTTLCLSAWGAEKIVSRITRRRQENAGAASNIASSTAPPTPLSPPSAQNQSFWRTHF